MVYYINFRVFQ